jgi:hypothetical protein
MVRTDTQNETRKRALSLLMGGASCCIPNLCIILPSPPPMLILRSCSRGVHRRSSFVAGVCWRVPIRACCTVVPKRRHFVLEGRVLRLLIWVCLPLGLLVWVIIRVTPVGVVVGGGRFFLQTGRVCFSSGSGGCGSITDTGPCSPASLHKSGQLEVFVFLRKLRTS